MLADIRKGFLDHPVSRQTQPGFQRHRISFHCHLDINSRVAGLTDQDRKIRRQIVEFMTRLRVALDPEQLADARSYLAQLFTDGLVRIEGHDLVLTEAGKPFLRNATVFFDERLRTAAPNQRIFSSSI